MITKEYINEIKMSNQNDIGELIKNQKDNASVISILESLGHLSPETNSDFLFDLLAHDYQKIRLLSAKNIAKINKVENLDTLFNFFKNEKDTSVKREMVSAQLKAIYL